MSRRVVLAAAVAAAAVAAVAFAASPPRPDPSQAEADGCVDDLGGMFTHEVPRWVYVDDRDAPATGPPPPAQSAQGRVLSGGEPTFYGVHPTPVDDPANHDSYDVNLNVAPDPPSAFLLGTANASGEGENANRLHVELEQAAFPLALWPEQGDRVSLVGSWVWDCPHEEGGRRTELHPFRALWVQRAIPSPRSPYGESEGDLLVTTDRTPAGRNADCAHLTKGDRGAFKECFSAGGDWADANGTYRFTLPLPPRPSPRARLAVRVVDAGSTATAPAVHVVPGRRSASVSVTVAAQAGLRVVVAKEIFAGWRPVAASALPDHLRLRFRRLLVRRAMDPGCPPSQPSCPSVETTRLGQISKPPGEWLLYSDVAGLWSSWPLLRVDDGQVVQLARKVDFYAPARGRYRVFVFARECDFGSVSASAPQRPPSPCPAGTNEFGDAAGDDAPGSVVGTYHGSVPTTSVDASRLESSCPAANTRGCYQLTFEVDRIDDAARRATRRR